MNRRILIVFSGISIVILLFSFLVISQFHLRKVIIISSISDIIGLEVFERQNLLLINNEEKITELLRRNSNVMSITLRKNYPQTIILEISVRKPEFIVLHNTRVIPIDKEGVVLTGMDVTDNLPKIEIRSSFTL